MYGFLLQSHSIFRWLVLLLLVICLFRSIVSWLRKAQVQKKSDISLNRYLFVSTHIQFLLGIALYFVSPSVQVSLSNFKMAMKSSYLRFWAIEHPLMMIVSLVLITIGYMVAKKKALVISKYRSLSIFYFMALVLILAASPWPFRDAVGRPWI